MTLHPVVSSNLSAVGYDHDTQKMRVLFRHGGIFEFQGVSPAKHRRFMAAKSKGGYFSAQFKDNDIYKGRRLAAHEV